MRYILQMHTGSLAGAAVAPRDAVGKLRQVLGALDVEAVIWGWAPDRALNEAISAALSDAGVQRFLWLPVFSEVHDHTTADAFVAIDGPGNAGIDLCAGENFEFVCPSSERNLLRAREMYAKIASGLDFTGVFLDRIRYPSAANAPSALAGCWCPRCRREYERAGVQIDRVERLFKSRALSIFEPRALEGATYRFDDPDADRLFGVKREIVSRTVGELCRHFRGRGLAASLDTFAPLVADYVGQDVFRLGAMADFIKPMMYRRTGAPAGIGFEVDAISNACGPGTGRRLSELWGGNALSGEVCLRQLSELQSALGNVAPGIEVNRMPGICDANPKYARDSIAIAGAAGCRSVVLSWNILRMQEDMIEAIRSL